MNILQQELSNCHEPVAEGSDLYDSFLPDVSGKRHRTQLVPRGYKSTDVKQVTHLVLKPDGEFFQQTYPRIGEGTTKGDREPARNCLLRYLLGLFPIAEIRCSGGTDLSFHTILAVDETVSDLLCSAPDRFARLLQMLRLIAFCDKVGGDLRRALYDNLDKDEALALAIDEAVRDKKQDDWRSNPFKIKKVRLIENAVIDQSTSVTLSAPAAFQTIA